MKPQVILDPAFLLEVLKRPATDLPFPVAVPGEVADLFEARTTSSAAGPATLGQFMGRFEARREGRQGPRLWEEPTAERQETLRRRFLALVASGSIVRVPSGLAAEGAPWADRLLAAMDAAGPGMDATPRPLRRLAAAFLGASALGPPLLMWGRRFVNSVSGRVGVLELPASARDLLVPIQHKLDWVRQLFTALGIKGGVRVRVFAGALVVGAAIPAVAGDFHDMLLRMQDP